MASNTSSRKPTNYDRTQPTRLPRSAFDRSCSHKTTFYTGRLVPIWCDEVIPGDTVTWRPSFLCRWATPLYPFMEVVRLEWQSFFVPARLVWDNWAKMMGERTDPSDHTDYTVPQVSAPVGGWSANSLSDYLGLPTEVDSVQSSALYHRAYALIWNEWYRDQNLQDSLVVPTDDGPDGALDEHITTLAYRGKRKDRFAGALPFAQKGDPVSLPLGDTAPVVSTGTNINFSASSGPSNNPWQSLTSTGSQFQNAWNVSGQGLRFGSGTGLETDLSSATAASINEIRLAVSLQRLFERDARSGSRYSEMILAHYGVQMPDIRYRPELLGVGSMDVYSNEVAATGGDTGQPDIGYLGGYVKGQQVGRGWTKSFDEFGFVFTIVSARGDVSYQQGVPAHFLRSTRVDHYMPDLANIGEEVIRTAEIYAEGTGDPDLQTGDYAVWGYSPRYEAYRQRVNQISGAFRSNATGSLDPWHFGLDFSSKPALNAAFIQEDPNPLERAIVLADEPHFLLDAFFKVTHVRPMPKFATPGILRF